MLVGDVVQFNENHKWCGCFGFIDEVSNCGDEIKYLICVPIPKNGIAYIFVMESENAFDRIGTAELMPSSGGENG